MSIIQILERLDAYRIVICLTISPPLPVTPPSLEIAEAEPGFFSKIFQNLRLSSAAFNFVNENLMAALSERTHLL